MIAIKFNYISSEFAINNINRAHSHIHIHTDTPTNIENTPSQTMKYKYKKDNAIFLLKQMHEAQPLQCKRHTHNNSSFTLRIQ